MAVKFVAAIIAVVLVVAYLLPVVIKLKEWSLGLVILLGIGMMLVDLWQSLRKPDA
jgi:hypothetical protein